MAAQMTMPRSSPATEDGDVEAQTRHLLDRLAHDDSRGVRGSVPNAQAFQSMQRDQPRDLFGPDSAMLDSLVDCLHQHAQNMLNDSRLQRQIQRLGQDISRETLWRVACKLFNRVQDVWTGILTLLAFGMELCRQMVVELYEYIVTTIASFITTLAGSWITQRGGWLAGAIIQGAGRLLGVTSN